jgi:hypothetical protein
MNNPTAEKVLKKTFEYLDQILHEKKREEGKKPEEGQKKIDCSPDNKKRTRETESTGEHSERT